MPQHQLGHRSPPRWLGVGLTVDGIILRAPVLARFIGDDDLQQAIPAGTALLNPVKQALSVVPGRVVLLRLYVPPGPRGEISLWFKHQNSQLAPSPPSTWDRLDGVTLEWPLDYEGSEGETQFHLYAASPDANFQHTIDFELLVEAAEEAQPTTTPRSIMDRVSGLFG